MMTKSGNGKTNPNLPRVVARMVSAAWEAMGAVAFEQIPMDQPESHMTAARAAVRLLLNMTREGTIRVAELSADEFEEWDSKVESLVEKMQGGR